MIADAVPLASPSADALWQRLAGLPLRLSDTVCADRLDYRGRPWYLLRDTLSRHQLRLSEAAYRVLAELDGRRTLAEVWQDLAGPAGDKAPPRRELLHALMQLQSAGMLDAGARSDVRPLVDRLRQQRRRQELTRWLRLLSPRLALVHPDRFLARLHRLLGCLFHPVALLAWLAIVLGAGVYALMQAEALVLYASQRLDDPRTWLLMVALYPVIKVVHELGHGLAAKRHGAEVNEMGITLLVFLPVPYVDASAASALPKRSQRMLVSGAGILVELLLAALAMFAWGILADGLAREAALAVMLIGGLSTLLFNGNPLLRFDGYYVLSDAIGIPNLATRANAYYGYLARRYLLALTEEGSPVRASGERRWFLAYAPASMLYRLAVAIGVALFLIAKVPSLGVVLAAWLLATQVVLPLVRAGHFLSFNATLAGRRGRAMALVVGLTAGVIGLLAWLPFPSSTQVDGVVLLPEQAIMRAEVEGFLVPPLPAFGERVRAGDELFHLRNPELERDIRVLRARIAELRARRDAAGFDDRLLREIQAERLAELGAELRELERRQAALTVRGPAAGRLRGPHLVDRSGRWVAQGDLLAYIADESRAIVRVIAPQAEAARIREGVDAIRVRSADRAGVVLSGELLGEVPAASDRLPSAALGSQAGGAIPVDARDPQGRQTLQPVFAFDVAVPYTQALQYIGSRAYVRFEHPAVPLLQRVYDAARRLVLAQIGE